MKKELLITTNIPDLSVSKNKFIEEIVKVIMESRKIQTEKGKYKGFYMTISGLYDIKLEAQSKRRSVDSLLKLIDKKEYPFGINMNETYVPLLILYSDNNLFKDYVCMATAELRDSQHYLVDKECEVSIYGIVSQWYEAKNKIKNIFKKGEYENE